ncbi:MAG: hypothetical protein L0K86_29710 [Actinomycetia bacterium]|nr:hypothetical protein [Actinomycetes bacterium]
MSSRAGWTLEDGALGGRGEDGDAQRPGLAEEPNPATVGQPEREGRVEPDVHGGVGPTPQITFRR